VAFYAISGGIFGVFYSIFSCITLRQAASSQIDIGRSAGCGAARFPE
jgi:hypothetical protein